MSDQKKSTEEMVERIEVIQGDEALGYTGGSKEEHSGENRPKKSGTLKDGLADNKPEDMPRA